MGENRMEEKEQKERNKKRKRRRENLAVCMDTRFLVVLDALNK